MDDKVLKQMKKISTHIFMFPFKWEIKEKKDDLFSDQISLNSINYGTSSCWKRVCKGDVLREKRLKTIYNEHNYFYDFVHGALYDNGMNDSDCLVRHYERKEPQATEVFYNIHTGGQVFTLNVDNIFLNLYSTGVGVLAFYVHNDKYAEISDVLKINQFGRRVYPQFFNDINIRSEIAQELSFEGLNGVYYEDFGSYTTSLHNKPADFILTMINEVATNVSVEPVIDDRMYVMSWYRNDCLAKAICNYDETEPETGRNKYLDEYNKNLSDWYKYVFVDSNFPTCQNKGMFRELLEKATYRRWQNCNSLYGISRYSFVMLSNAGDDAKYLYDYFETEYVRMAELVLVQKASILRFSQEVTRISTLDKRKKLLNRVNSLYEEYIRFVNQIHFREVSAQDQAIELYQMLYKQMDIEHQVEKLDGEIDELHTYVNLVEDRQKTRVMDAMAIGGGIALPATVLTGFYGMNNLLNGAAGGDQNWTNDFCIQFGSILLCVFIFSAFLWYYIKKK